MKLKVLGLGLLAILAMSATAVMNAGASTGGHFVSDVSHTLLEGEDKPGETTRLIDHHGGHEIKCHNDAKYHGTISGTTVTEVTITPTYTGCTDSEGRTAHVAMNGCHYVFTVNTSPSTSDNTVHLVCPPEKQVHISVTGPFGTCTIDLAAQTPAGGIAYTTGGSGSTHDITADVTVTGIKMTYTGGFFICEEANGTVSTTATMVGSATLKGFDTTGNQVGITAT